MRKIKLNKIIYACDIGSTKSKRFAWVRLDANNKLVSGTEIDVLLQNLISDLKSCNNISIGFEAPLFLPMPTNSSRLSTGRPGEGSRSCFAPAGACVANLAMHQILFIFDKLKTFLINHEYTLEWDKWGKRNKCPLFLCWEAFVSGNAHAQGPANHLADAETAAVFFKINEDRLSEVKSTESDTSPAFSLVHSAALRSGISKDLGLLSSINLVLKPDQLLAVSNIPKKDF